MSVSSSTSGAASPQFREHAFHRLPLVVMAAAAVAGAVGGSAWSERLGPLPWLVSLAVVGLPHGAADFAASRATWHGRALAAVWLAYAAAMAAVAAGFVLAPGATIIAFIVVSCWHFGAAHLDADSCVDPPSRLIAILARGSAALAMPLAGWPADTAKAAASLAALAIGNGVAMDLFSTSSVRAAGLMLIAVSVAAAVLEVLLDMRRPGRLRGLHRLPMELATIASLGWFTAPLFSVGVYFLVWHAWRQMEPLAESLTDIPCRSWSELVAALIRIHIAALPLLLPTWAAIGAVWWLWSPSHSFRDLAIVSIGGYLVVTPAHELLGDVLRTMANTPAPMAAPGPRVGLHPRRHPLPSRKSPRWPDLFPTR
jgi:Brp/Blh family beta-carotene 15,15'-monooxygenase